MRPGPLWSDGEVRHLMRAWVTVSQDTIFGFEHTSQTFSNKMYKLFSSFKPRTASDMSYDGRGMKAARSNFDSIGTNMQTFKISKREVRAFEPTGTTAKQNQLMAIARHYWRMSTIIYESKEFSHERWTHHLAIYDLRRILKFNDDPPSPLSSTQAANITKRRRRWRPCGRKRYRKRISRSIPVQQTIEVVTVWQEPYGEQGRFRG